MLASLLPWLALAAQGAGTPPPAERIPVYACISVPPQESTPERYRELADAGFTMSLSGFGSLAGPSRPWRRPAARASRSSSPVPS
jgi:hypothetical protein